MFKYIVTWCLVVSTWGYDQFVYDEFGRMSIKYIPQYYNNCDHSKTFDTRQEAFDFMYRAMEEHDVINVELDSALVDTLGWIADSIYIGDSIIFFHEKILDSIINPKYRGDVYFR